MLALTSCDCSHELRLLSRGGSVLFSSLQYGSGAKGILDHLKVVGVVDVLIIKSVVTKDRPLTELRCYHIIRRTPYRTCGDPWYSPKDCFISFIFRPVPPLL